MGDRLTAAKLVFSLDAVLGILSAGGGALYAAALSSGNVWAAFLAIFVPSAMLWSLFCYLAYRGLTGENVALRVLFWSHVVGHVFVFPIGTAIAGASIWLWRELRKQGIQPASV